MGTSVSMPSLTTVAVFGCRTMRLRMASDVCPLARASRSRPSSTRQMTMAEASK